MATPTSQASNIGSESLIAGYFASGEDAHRAINALLDEGFSTSQIGAAFHTSGTPSAASSADSSTGNYVSSSMREDLGSTITDKVVDTDGSAGGAESDTTAVQPAGLSTGSGSTILGAGKPGPISGSDLSHTGLPSELTSELGHDQPGSAPRAAATSSYATPAPVESVKSANTSWTEKLKHLFQPKSDASKPSTATAANKEAQNFGTGEGHINLEGPYGQPYSPATFATSVSSAGVPADQSRHLSSRLSTGGAVVTVSATGRAVEVEKIFERYNGVVRFESDIFNDSPALDYEPRVEVFGHLEHHYSGL